MMEAVVGKFYGGAQYVFGTAAERRISQSWGRKHVPRLHALLRVYTRTPRCTNVCQHFFIITQHSLFSCGRAHSAFSTPLLPLEEDKQHLPTSSYEELAPSDSLPDCVSQWDADDAPHP